MLLVESSAIGRELSVIHIVHARMTHSVHTYTCVEGKLEILQEADFRKRRTHEGIALGIVLIQGHEPESIRIRGIRAHHSGILSISEIIHLQATLIQHHLSGSISDIHRIDRSHRCCKSEHIADRSGTTLLTVAIVEVIIGI